MITIMKKPIFTLLLCASGMMGLQAQTLTFKTAKFKVGDEVGYKSPDFNATGWRDIRVTDNWDNQGVPADTRFAWYRIEMRLR